MNIKLFELFINESLLKDKIINEEIYFNIKDMLNYEDSIL